MREVVERDEYNTDIKHGSFRIWEYNTEIYDGDFTGRNDICTVNVLWDYWLRKVWGTLLGLQSEQ